MTETIWIKTGHIDPQTPALGHGVIAITQTLVHIYHRHVRSKGERRRRRQQQQQSGRTRQQTRSYDPQRHSCAHTLWIFLSRWLAVTYDTGIYVSVSPLTGEERGTVEQFHFAAWPEPCGTETRDTIRTTLGVDNFKGKNCNYCKSPKSVCEPASLVLGSSSTTCGTERVIKLWL